MYIKLFPDQPEPYDDLLCADIDVEDNDIRAQCGIAQNSDDIFVLRIYFDPRIQNIVEGILILIDEDGFQQDITDLIDPIEVPADEICNWFMTYIDEEA